MHRLCGVTTVKTLTFATDNNYKLNVENSVAKVWSSIVAVVATDNNIGYLQI